MNPTQRCPCQSGDTFGACCGRFLGAVGTAFPPTAQALMRSRFTAFATNDADYLLATWHPEHRPTELELDPEQQWYRLDILDTKAGGPLDTDGVVTFRAHYRYHGARESFTETSSFVRTGRQWLYVAALSLG
ncbi:YchJ family protein [Arthrobacter sp. GMC3]|uniref:YchJ family protein n=1 Tax=Arthrobacter sp. GMC3 TaxID=2058894 RepID=UPI000CE366E5|nr:YchJ family metal-binding protein [Arthrobacter sp. GMC3]